MGTFMKILLTRTPDLSAYERSQNHPLLREPKYGLDYEPWRAPHTVTNAFGHSSSFNEAHIHAPTAATPTRI